VLWTWTLAIRTTLTIRRTIRTLILRTLDANTLAWLTLFELTTLTGRLIAL
jgi:hypothetical protein